MNDLKAAAELVSVCPWTDCPLMQADQPAGIRTRQLKPRWLTRVPGDANASAFEGNGQIQTWKGKVTLV